MLYTSESNLTFVDALQSVKKTKQQKKMLKIPYILNFISTHSSIWLYFILNYENIQYFWLKKLL